MLRQMVLWTPENIRRLKRGELTCCEDALDSNTKKKHMNDADIYRAQQRALKRTLESFNNDVKKLNPDFVNVFRGPPPAISSANIEKWLPGVVGRRMISGLEDDEMGVGLPPSVEEIVQNDMLCSFCDNVAEPPIYTCQNGHFICEKCTVFLSKCPHGPNKETRCNKLILSSSRCLLFELLYKKALLPCRYKLNGCTELVRGREKYAHEDKCAYSRPEGEEFPLERYERRPRPEADPWSLEISVDALRRSQLGRRYY